MIERDESVDDESVDDESVDDVSADAGRPSGSAAPATSADDSSDTDPDTDRPVEVGGQKGPEPTRYGDWEGRGRCTDF